MKVCKYERPEDARMRIVREGCAALPNHVHDGNASMPQCKTASTVAVVLVRREVQICNVALLWRELEEVDVHCLSWSVTEPV